MATMDDAAAQYLDKWMLHEEPIYVALLATSPEKRRLALGRAATYFRVVRNLRRYEDELGVPRFEPLRQCVDAISSHDASNEHFTVATVSLGRTIASEYGGKNYLSLASKLLWMRFRHPFVIYDSRVQKALRTPSGDYHAYVTAWHARYAPREAAIRSACSSLTASLPGLRCGPALTDAHVRQIAAEEWFRRRVMDIFIWLGGA
ncbi:MAG: hypothetical protein ABI651_05895 [Verrucomicrobiota bacterium]